MKGGTVKNNKGFTLVELLVVIMIIAILSGMALLASGSSIDSAEATRVVNDIRDVKVAAAMYYLDNHSWPPGPTVPIASLDKYMDGRSSGFAATKYNGIHILQNAATDRLYIGLGLKNNNATDGVRKKLAINADNSGIYEDAGNTPYGGTGLTVYMHLK
jgi:prepilin-type N-terminal cleavage/methylation domain-containing protein